MENYCAIACEKRNSDALIRWISSCSSVSKDVIEFIECKDNKCYYIANRAHNDKSADGGLFKSYAIDHQKRIVYSGSEEAPNVNWPLLGCYIRFQRDIGDIIVGNDLFSQLPMLYFAERGVVAISDSVLVLSEIRQIMGYPNRVNIDAALSRAWIHGMASQPLGTSTLIDGIKYCPPGSKIRVNLSENRPLLRIEKVLVEDIFLDDAKGYKDSILESAQRIASVIATLAISKETHTTISLSGGADSRVCLAAALACQNQGRIFFATGKSNKEDYLAAQKIAERFSFDFKSPVQETCKSKEHILNWFLSCAGIYDPLTCSRPHPQKINFVIGGHGAEACKGNFGWRSLSAITPAKVGHVSAIRPATKQFEIKKREAEQFFSRYLNFFVSELKLLIGKHAKVDGVISDAAYSKATQGLHSVGIGADNRRATEWHYLCFRNAIHSGRSTMSTLLGVAPLLQRELVGLSRSGQNEYPEPKEGAPSIITDLLIALNPELAMLPFDDPKKNLDPSYVHGRSRYLGQVNDIHPYATIGDPYAVNSGTPEIFCKLAERRGFTGNYSSKAIKQLTQQGYEEIPHEIRKAYDMPRYLVENQFPDNVTGSSWTCIAAGKLMSFLLLK